MGFNAGDLVVIKTFIYLDNHCYVDSKGSIGQVISIDDDDTARVATKYGREVYLPTTCLSKRFTDVQQ